MQLVAYGAQDIYLTGNPQITFFKVVYRRHTNFSMETIQQTIQGASTTAGGSGSVTISRNGDLVSKVYVTSNTAGIESGCAMVAQVELEIGGQLIDRQTEEWMQIWDELTTPDSRAFALKAMKCEVEDKLHASGDTATNTGPGLVQIPLNLWFCRNPGLALPLIALQYHEVKLKFTWGVAADVGGHTAVTATCQVWCDYIYLDTDERRRFAQVSHEYLIEQIQSQTYVGTTAGAKKLNFNHPVKELIWTSQGSNAYKTAKLALNGHDRFAEQEEEYFQLRQPHDYHTAIPEPNLPVGSSAPKLKHQITKAPLIHTNGNGLATAAMTNTAGTWVEVAGSSAPLTAAPAAAAALTDATTSASCFLVGALTAQSGIKDGAIKLGDKHLIQVTDDSGAVIKSFHNTVQRVVLSDLAAHDTVVEIGGRKGPLNYELTEQEVLLSATGSKLAALPNFANYGLDVALLASGGAGGDITNATGGAVMICYEKEMTFAAALESGRDSTQIYNKSDSVLVHLQSAVAGSVHLARTSNFHQRINVYSFALKPEEHQPSGTCNFSRIDNAQLTFEVAPGSDGTIYAVNYNVLRIMSGMGGLAYSN